MESTSAKYLPDSHELEELLRKFRKRITEYKFPLTPRSDTEFLLKYLRIKNYSLDNSFGAFKRYYDNVKANYDLFSGVRPSDFKEAFMDGPIKCLKHRHKGSRIVIVSFKKWKPKEISLSHLHTIGVMLTEFLCLELETQDSGIVFVFDCQDLSFEHVWQLSPKHIRRIMYAEQGLPLKIPEVHVIHPPSFFWPLYTVISRFTKEKLRKRNKFHIDFESFYKLVDSAVCPESIGGKLPDKEAFDTEFIDGILQKNIYYEEMWNGDGARRNE